MDGHLPDADRRVRPECAGAFHHTLHRGELRRPHLADLHLRGLHETGPHHERGPDEHVPPPGAELRLRVWSEELDAWYVHSDCFLFGVRLFLVQCLIVSCSVCDCFLSIPIVSCSVCDCFLSIPIVSRSVCDCFLSIPIVSRSVCDCFLSIPIVSCSLCGIYISDNVGTGCNSVVRVFAHGAMDRRIDPSWWTH